MTPSERTGAPGAVGTVAERGWSLTVEVPALDPADPVDELRAAAGLAPRG